MQFHTNPAVKLLFWVAVIVCLISSLFPIVAGVNTVSAINPAAVQIANILKPFSAICGVFLLLIGWYETHLWKLRIKKLAVCPQPCLIGTWKGELRSNYLAPGTTTPISPREVFLVIRQTLTTISVRFLTQESSSHLLAGALIREEDGVYSVTGTYMNTPKISLQGRSPIHHGALLLRVHGDVPDRLEGEYWTTRNTNGELEFTGKSSKLHTDYAAAVADTTYKSR